MDSYKIADSYERKSKILSIIFFPVFFISLLATSVLWYKSYIEGNGGNVPVIMVILIIMVVMLLIPPTLVLFSKRRISTWLMVFILIVLLPLWEIGFDGLGLLIFPIIVDIFILAYTKRGPRVLNN